MKKHTLMAMAAGGLLAASWMAQTPAWGQDLGVKAPAQVAPVVIVNATIYPVSGAPFAGAISFANGVITDVVAGKIEPGPGSTVVDGTGKHVYPGLISPYSQLGLREIEAVRPSTDMNEAGSVTPEALATVAVNPDSVNFPVTRANGVLLAGVFPVGGLVPGRAGVVRLDGWTTDDMTARRDAGLVVEWPLMRTVRAFWMDRSDEDQQRDIRQGLERVRDVFKTAAAYSAAKTDKPDLRWESMRSVFARGGEQRPIFVQANDYDQIVAAVELARQYSLRLVIVGGLDAPRCAKLLIENNVPVIVTGVMALPRRDDAPYDDNFSLPRRLHEAGVAFCIANGDDTAHERNLPYAAAMAAAHGLPAEQALRAVTLSAAEVLGIADRYGSLEKGKSATLIVTDGNPLEVTTVVERAYIDGRAIDLRSKHSALAEKYRERYRQSAPAQAGGGGGHGEPEKR